MTSSLTTGKHKPQALAGLSLRTWVMLVIGMVLLWSTLGYVVLQ